MISPSMKDSKTSYECLLRHFPYATQPLFFLSKLPRRKRSHHHAKFLREKEYYGHAFPQRIDFNDLTKLQQFNNLTKSNFPQNTLQPFNNLTKFKEVGMCLGHGEPTPTITPCRMDGI